MAKVYTYTEFAQDVIKMMKGEKPTGTVEEMIEKATALYDTNVKKAEYNKKSPKKSTAKGASDKTKAVIAELEKVFAEATEPKTAADINTILGTEYTALAIANAVKFMPDVTSEKVVRDTLTGKGLKVQREYTAYIKVKAEPTAEPTA